MPWNLGDHDTLALNEPTTTTPDNGCLQTPDSTKYKEAAAPGKSAQRSSCIVCCCVAVVVGCCLRGCRCVTIERASLCFGLLVAELLCADTPQPNGVFASNTEL